MMNIEYKHTLTVRRDAWFIRFYVWLWEASPADINICKLFWGYVFCWLALLIRLVFVPIDLLGNLISKKRRAVRLRREEYEREKPPPPPTPERERSPFMQTILNAISGFFAKVAYIISSVWYFLTKHKRVNAVLANIIVGIGALLALAAVAWAVYLAVTNFDVTKVILMGAAGIAVGCFLAWFILISGLYEKMVNWVAKPTGKAVKKGGMGFGEMMAAGFVAVKSNTCPKIVVNDPKEG